MSVLQKLGAAISENNRIAWLAGAGILSAGFGLGAVALADGLVEMKRADREVTVRGVAEREVTANRASWSVSYSESAYALAEALAKADADTKLIQAFLKEQGFTGETTAPSSANISANREMIDDKPTGRTIYSVSRSISFTTAKVSAVQQVEARKDALAQQGLVVDNTSASFEYTQLDTIKPEMIGEATKDARRAAEKFADDSGSDVGGIRSATQGYFSVSARDEAGGDDEYGGGSSTASTPDQKVRVVTTIVYYLD
jgi:uncharacterized protein